MSELFSVCQFFQNTSYEYEYARIAVPAEEAMPAAFHYCTSVGAKLGFTTRVIVTDGGDNIVFEWKHDEGITFPPGPGIGKFKLGVDDRGVRT